MTSIYGLKIDTWQSRDRRKLNLITALYENLQHIMHHACCQNVGFFFEIGKNLILLAITTSTQHRIASPPQEVKEKKKKVYDLEIKNLNNHIFKKSQ